MIPARIRHTPLWRLIRADKPIGSWLLLWPALWALWLAAAPDSTAPPLRLVAIFTAGAVCMRSLGCLYNDLLDRRFDAHVARTRDRPLASGAMQVHQAIAPGVVLLLIAMGLASCLQLQTMGYAAVALGLTGIYPLMKRIMPCPQVVLGMAFGMSIPMAFQEIRGHAWDRDSLSLYIGVISWVVAYDTLYARMDKADDLRLGLYSTAIWWGSWDCVGVLFSMGILLAALGSIGIYHSLGWGYTGAWIACLPIIGAQLWLTQSSDRTDQLAAFTSHNAIGALIFLGFWSGIR